MNIIIDTNCYSAFCRGIPEVVKQLQLAHSIYIPFITIAELRAGFMCGTSAKKNDKILNLFLSKQRVNTLFADEQTTHHYARLFYQLRNQGTPLPTNDIWIAALTL